MTRFTTDDPVTPRPARRAASRAGIRLGSTRSGLRHSVWPAGAVAGVLLLTSVAAPSPQTSGGAGTEQDLSLQLVGRVRKTTTTTRPTSTTVAPTTTTTTAPSSPVTASYFAGLEKGDFSELQMHQANNGVMAVDSTRAATGSWSAKATVNGGVGAQYARVGNPGPWNTGAKVVYRGSFFFPTGFFANLTNQMDLMRLDNWDDRPTAAEYTGLTINLSGTGGATKRLYMFRNQLGSGGQGITYTAGPFLLPSENAWHSIEVRQTLSPVNGAAVNSLYLDGVHQGTSTVANMFGATGNRYNWFRAGVVSSGQTQTNPISLWVDNLSMTKP